MNTNYNLDEQTEIFIKNGEFEEAINHINKNKLNINGFLPSGQRIISSLFNIYQNSDNKDIEVLKDNILFFHEKGIDLNQIGLDKDNAEPWLIKSLQLKDKELVSWFLKSSEPDDRPWTSYQALLFACQNDVPLEILRSLLEDPFINPNDLNEMEENSLFVAASGNDELAPNRVFSLLHHNVNRNETNKNLENALFCAAQDGSSKTLKLLLTAGVDPNQLDIEGNTPISKIKLNDNMTEEEKEESKNKVKFLIEAGAFLDIKNYSGQSPKENPLFKDWIEWMSEIENNIKARMEKFMLSNNVKESLPSRKVKM